MTTHKQVLQPVAVRRSRRQVLPTSRFGVFEDSREMPGEEESATTCSRTSGEYSPGETCSLLFWMRALPRIFVSYAWGFDGQGVGVYKV